MSGERGAEQLDRQAAHRLLALIRDGFPERRFDYLQAIGDALEAYESALATAEQRAEQAERELNDMMALAYEQGKCERLATEEQLERERDLHKSEHERFYTAFQEETLARNEAERRVGELEAQLAAVEWYGYSIVGAETCPSCGGERWAGGHEQGCALAAALAGSVSEAETPCTHPTTSFDRTVCACGEMHSYCESCGAVLDCPLDGAAEAETPQEPAP